MTANDNLCVNLRGRFGQRYRIGFDEVAVTWGERADPWMQTMPCQRGTIYPFGGSLLAVEIDNRPVTAKQVAAIPSVVIHQDGDHEKTFLFPVDLFDQVAEVVKPRKRRRLSEEQKARLAEVNKETRFQPRSPGAQSRRDELGRVRPAQGG